MDRMQAQFNIQADVPDLQSALIPTLNKTGYMTSWLDEYSEAFVEFSSKVKDPVLEIGAAYGIASLEAIKRGATVIANDIDARHLDILKTSCPTKLLSRLTLKPGEFPEQIKCKPNSIAGILIARVLHFFSGEKIEQSICIAKEWLKKGGKLFIVAETPFCKNFSKYLPEYEKKRSSGDPWPGFIPDVSKYDLGRSEQLPKQANWLDPEVLTRVLEKYDFSLEKIGFINRREFPEDIRLDGRESIGVIAINS